MGTHRKRLIGTVLLSLILGACTSTGGVPSNSFSAPTPTVAVGPRGSTPTARVLKRADLPPGAAGVVPGNASFGAGAIRALPKAGAVAPDFTLRTLDGALRQPQPSQGAQGETITLSKLRGHPVLINFWASWCLACRAEAPELQRVYAEFKDHGLIVLGVNVTQQDTLAGAQAYISEFGLAFPILMDEQGDAGRAYSVVGLPTSFFIDPRGVVRDVVIGQMSRATIFAGLDLTKPW